MYYEETPALSVYEFIKYINNDIFPYSLDIVGNDEWKIAAEYLPDGNTKTIVKAIVLKKLENNKAEAIKILKQSMEAEPEYMVYELFRAFNNENYTTDEELQLIDNKFEDLYNVEFKAQVNPKCLKDIVGNKFVPGCKYFEEINRIFNESTSLLNSFNDTFKKTIESTTSEELMINLINYEQIIKKDLHNALNKKAILENYIKVYELIGLNPVLYKEGILDFLTSRLGLKAFKASEFISNNEGTELTLCPIINLVVKRKIANDEILRFLSCFSDSNSKKPTKTEVLILYSKIFELQGFPKAQRGYLKLASKREDFETVLKLFA